MVVIDVGRSRVGGACNSLLRWRIRHAVQREVARKLAGLGEIFANLPSDRPSDGFWGYYRTVEINGEVVLLFKSNTHLDWPGATILTALIKLLIADVNPRLILSIGTAGGVKPQDHIGTVRAVSAGTLFESGKPASSWPDYRNGWTANGATFGNANFHQLLFPVPTKTSDLQTLCSQFNQHYHGSFTLSGARSRRIETRRPDAANRRPAGGGTTLLTASTFVVGTTAGTYQNYAGDRDGRRDHR